MLLCWTWRPSNTSSHVLKKLMHLQPATFCDSEKAFVNETPDSNRCRVIVLQYRLNIICIFAYKETSNM
ncbi:hypothetical protein Hanom_Chr09g00775531 [Helianthus anomalus]